MMDLTRMKDIREDNDITQEKMAQILNVKRSTYALWENRVHIIPLKRLCDFASYFELSIDYVLGLNDERICKCVVNKLNLILLGNNIKKLRIKNGFSQIDFAKVVGVTQQCILQYEKGRICIPVDNLYTICKKFNISFNDILTKEL